jgi:hypothetical protein
MSGVYRWIDTVTGGSYVGTGTIIKRTIKCSLNTNYVKPISISLLCIQLY